MSSRTVKVQNVGGQRALVGDKYLLPGEQRTVLRSYYETAKGKGAQLREIGAETPLEESEGAGEHKSSGEGTEGGATEAKGKRRGK